MDMGLLLAEARHSTSRLAAAAAPDVGPLDLGHAQLVVLIPIGAALLAGFIDTLAGGGGLILADWMSFEAMYRLMAVFMAACVAVTLR